MEVVLAHAQQQGAEFPAELPLIPTLQDIKRLISRDASAQAEGTANRQPPRRSIWDAQEEGEFTYFEGKGRQMKNGDDEAIEVYNAVGFFMYTQCRDNQNGEWPAVLRASPAMLLLLLTVSL
jgi:hypothetical protein